MKRTTLIFLLAGIFLNSIVVTPFADVLDNWTTNQISTNAFAFHHVVYGNGIYVAVGSYSDDGAFYTSVDGLHWKLQYSEPNSWGVTLNYSGGRFSSVGQALGTGVTDVSSDGTNWSTTISPLSGNSAYLSGITYGNGLYVIVGSTNNFGFILTSPNGTLGTWTYAEIYSNSSINPFKPGPVGPISGVTYGAHGFVAIGNNDGHVYTSGDGTAWFSAPIPGGSKISFANGLFFVPLNDKTNLLSADGANWSMEVTGLTNMLGVVTYSHGVYMAQCGISRSGSYLATSTDGTNWFQYSKRLPNYCAISDTTDFDVSVATDGTRLVTGSSTGSFYYDGFIYTSDPLVEVRLTNSSTPEVAISGLVGRTYQIQSTDFLRTDSINWRTNITLQLTNTPYVWTDSFATNSQRFYRGVLLP